MVANSVDVIVSNCVINLAADKEKVLKEAFNVLKVGGEIFFSDIYADQVHNGTVNIMVDEDMNEYLHSLTSIHTLTHTRTHTRARSHRNPFTLPH